MSTTSDLVRQAGDTVNCQVEALGEIHLYTLSPMAQPEYSKEPFSLPAPVAEDPLPYGWLAKIFKGLRAKTDAENERRADLQRVALTQWQTAKADHDAVVAGGRRLFNSAMAGDLQAMEARLEAELRSIVWEQETNVSISISVDGHSVELDVDLPEIEDIPTKQASVPERGLRLNVKELGPVQVQGLYMRHVHAIGFSRVLKKARSPSDLIDDQSKFTSRQPALGLETVF